MIPREHQIEGALWALETIRSHGLAYLSWQERCGKSLAALLTVEYSKAKTCLIVTKKKAIAGWEETLSSWEHSKSFTVLNYESIHKLDKEFDFIILDESHHAISSTGKTSKTWKNVYKFTRGKPILYLSATPYAEHLGLIYNQLALSKWTPFKFKNFYEWFRRYGIPHKTRTPYGLVETYTKYHDSEILKVIEPYFNFKTREEVGIEHEPSVNVVIVPLSKQTKELITKTLKDEILSVGDLLIPLDSSMKTRMCHYQIESGVVKISDNTYVQLGNSEKLQYIKDNYDLTKIAIMAHFIGEREFLTQRLPGVKIYSADGDAEGVDMSHIDKLIISSMSFKTSKYTQRLARQANHNRKTPIVVDILVADKPGIGYEVYKSVAIKKENFDKNSYNKVWEN